MFRNPFDYFRNRRGSRYKLATVGLTNGLVLQLHSGNSDINSVTEIFCSKGYAELLNALKPQSTLVDVGANLGFVSLAAAQRIKTGRIVAFEPNPILLPLLHDNIRINGSTDRIRVVAKGVAGRSGKRIINYCAGHWGGASFADDEPMSRGHEHITIDCVGARDLFDFIRVRRIDFLKLDCEGAEGEILEALTPQDYGRIGAVFVEYHEPRVSAEFIAERLEGAGFDVKIMPDLPAFFALSRAHARPR